MIKYLLSTGDITVNPDLYLIDRFKLHLGIWPGDIPGKSNIGFDFILSGINKDKILDTLTDRLKELARKFDSSISIDQVVMIDYKTAEVVISAGSVSSSTIINIYEE